ncbi:MAG TPA: hypothetical protein VH280_03165 [Verrucomicrobiae bacterium]|nr:hypothetical protein [Verrucomicrobiae bacterium]
MKRAIRWLLVSVSAFSFAGGLLFAGDANGWGVKIVRLQILAPVTEENTNTTDVYRHTAALVRSQDGISLPGVTVGMVLTAPDGQIVGFDQLDSASSALMSFTDNRGKDLLTEMPWESIYPKDQYGIYSYQYNNGAHALFIGIRAPSLPSSGATGLDIAGNICVQTARSTEQLVAEDVRLKSGTEFSLGDTKLLVCDAKYIGGQFLLDLESIQDLSSISKLQFFDRRGREIFPLDYQSKSSSTDGSAWVYFFHKRADLVKIVATHWIGFKKTQVPFNIRTGLGF